MKGGKIGKAEARATNKLYYFSAALNFSTSNRDDTNKRQAR
jgi:hypothetical protein